MDDQGCLNKQRHLIETLASFTSQEEKYTYIIELGRASSSMPIEDRQDTYLVPGCQSLLYLKVELKNGLLSILTYSDALISAGLATLLTYIYNGESPEAIFKYPPIFLKETDILNILSPSRANGLKSLYQKLQKEALKWFQ